MTAIDYVLLAVGDPLASAETYTRLLGVEPVEKASTFVLYVLPNGLKLGLWAKADMKPTPGAPGGVEICFTVQDAEAVRRTWAEWRGLGLTSLQEPTQMDFGYTCVLADADGHRLRPFAVARPQQ